MHEVTVHTAVDRSRDRWQLTGHTAVDRSCNSLQVTQQFTGHTTVYRPHNLQVTQQFTGHTIVYRSHDSLQFTQQCTIYMGDFSLHNSSHEILQYTQLQLTVHATIYSSHNSSEFSQQFTVHRTNHSSHNSSYTLHLKLHQTPQCISQFLQLYTEQQYLTHKLYCEL